jgi:thiamine-monophosphate kinase
LGLANACIDLSDGLLADLAHVCARSGVGAQLQLERLPASAELAELPAEQRWNLQACGGDDYELCFTATPRHRESIQQAMDFAGVTVARIGRIVQGSQVSATDSNGEPWRPSRPGYEHFR